MCEEKETKYYLITFSHGGTISSAFSELNAVEYYLKCREEGIVRHILSCFEVDKEQIKTYIEVFGKFNIHEYYT